MGGDGLAQVLTDKLIKLQYQCHKVSARCMSLAGMTVAQLGAIFSFD